MDLLKQTFESFNPNFEVEQELKSLRLYTLTLGERTYQTTNSREAFLFSHGFGNRAGFSMSSKPYSGKEINTVVNVKQ